MRCALATCICRLRPRHASDGGPHGSHGFHGSRKMVSTCEQPQGANPLDHVEWPADAHLQVLHATPACPGTAPAPFPTHLRSTYRSSGEVRASATRSPMKRECAKASGQLTALRLKLPRIDMVIRCRKAECLPKLSSPAFVHVRAPESRVSQMMMGGTLQYDAYEYEQRASRGEARKRVVRAWEICIGLCERRPTPVYRVAPPWHLYEYINNAARLSLDPAFRISGLHLACRPVQLGCVALLGLPGLPRLPSLACPVCPVCPGTNT